MLKKKYLIIIFLENPVHSFLLELIKAYEIKADDALPLMVFWSWRLCTPQQDSGTVLPTVNVAHGQKWCRKPVKIDVVSYL